MPLVGAGAVLNRDRTFVISGIVCIAAIAWAYMLYLGWGMEKSMGMEYAFISDPPRIDLRGILTSQADSRRELHLLGLDGY
jgi:predicted metal-binding membrane protein